MYGIVSLNVPSNKLVRVAGIAEHDKSVAGWGFDLHSGRVDVITSNKEAFIKKVSTLEGVEVKESP